MANLVFAMMMIVVTWSLIFGLFAGIGLMIRRIVVGAPGSSYNIIQCFWLGYAITLFCLQIWHLGFPVNWLAVLPLIIVALCGLTGAFAVRISFLKIAIFKHYKLLIAMVILTVFFSNLCIGPPKISDTILYHINTVQWNNEYRIVPGLGNLHSRLAFNQSHFLYVSLVESCLWHQRSFHVANGILILVVAIQLSLAGWRIIVRRLNCFAEDLFQILMLVPFAFFVFNRYHFTGISPDLPVLILPILLCSELIGLVSNRQITRKEKLFSVVIVIILGSTGPTIKLSSAAFCITAVVVSVFFYVKSERIGIARSYRIWVLSGCSVFVLTLPWMIRGSILSGYPFYPLTLIELNVDWKMPRESVLNEMKLVRGWSRVAVAKGGTTKSIHWKDAVDGWDWFQPWIRSVIRNPVYLISMVIPLSLFVIGVFTAVYFEFVRKRHIDYSIWLVLLPWLLGAFVWFINGPNPRFAGTIFWTMAAGIVTLHLTRSRQFSEHDWVSQTPKFVYLTVIILVIAFRFRNGFLFYASGPDHGFHPAPSQTVATFVTDSGLVLYVPDSSIGGQGIPPYGPLTRTLTVNNELTLRHSDDLSYGFRQN